MSVYITETKKAASQPVADFMMCQHLLFLPSVFKIYVWTQFSKNKTFQVEYCL